MGSEIETLGLGRNEFAVVEDEEGMKRYLGTKRMPFYLYSHATTLSPCEPLLPYFLAFKDGTVV